MKKQIISSTIFLMLLTGSFISCKKDTDYPIIYPPPTPVDYSPAFTNATWVGEFHYSNAAVQPFTAFFRDDGTVIWREVSKDNLGSWKLENREINIVFRGSVSFKATVSMDNKLMNIISTDQDGRILDNAGLNNDPEMNLDNTSWIYPNFTANFKAGGLVEIFVGSARYVTTYNRYEKSVRFNPYNEWRWFMVPGVGTTMKVANWFVSDTLVYSFTATRR